MEVSSFQFLLISILFGFSTGFVPVYMVCYPLTPPLVLGYLIGLILGQPMQGAVIGASITLVYMGTISVGGTQPANPMIGTVLGTTFALMNGLTYEAALALAVPIGIVFASLRVWGNTGAVFFAQGVSRSVHKRKLGAMWAWSWAGLLYKVLLYTVLMFVVLQFGITAASQVLGNIPKWFNAGLNVAGNALPAVGIALGLKYIADKGRIYFCMLTFILAAQLRGLSTLVCVLVTLAVIVILTYKKIENGEIDIKMTTASAKKHILSAKDAIFATFMIENILEWVSNSAKKMGEGFLIGIAPTIKKLYPNDEERQCEELEKHDAFLNSNMQFMGALAAPVVAMEEERAMGNPDITPETIASFKASLQGPIAAIGDPLAQGVLNTIIKSIGVSMVVAGSVGGVYFTFFGFMALKIAAAIVLGYLGFKYGSSIVEKFYSGGAAKYFTEMAGVIGCVAFGALGAATIRLGVGKLEVVGVALQTTLFDAILPGILPIALLFICYKLLKSKKVGAISLMAIVFFGTFILGALGILQ
ncbi:MAG: PTS system mannose/fructose/sorbose family transporter subunit IID [Peptococcaceae bacterium]|jgi:PTS system mannose-specific IID component|nr:PTS system mannose/fructose/sorbose family transporter subunit IID [Peptococcaceae bacterium]